MQSRLRFILQILRLNTLPLTLIPVCIGFMLAWQHEQSWHWGLFLLALFTALSAQLAIHAIDTLRHSPIQSSNRQQGLPGTASPSSTSTSPHSLTLTRNLFIILLLCTFGSSLILTIFRPWALAWVILGCTLAVCTVVPPLRLADRGHGLGELLIFLSCGLLPLSGAYYIQAGMLAWQALFAAFPVGFSLATLFYFYRLHHHHSAQNGTDIPSLGEQDDHRARIIGACLLVLISLSLLLTTLFLQTFPWYSVISALTILPALVQLAQPKNGRKWLDAIILSSIQTALLLLIALLIRGFLGI